MIRHLQMCPDLFVGCTVTPSQQYYTFNCSATHKLVTDFLLLVYSYFLSVLNSALSILQYVILLLFHGHVSDW